MAVLVFVGLVLAGSVAVMAGRARWQAETAWLRARLAAEELPVQPDRVDFAELDGLPAPVQRYLRLVLRPGQPMISRLHLRHTGAFNMGRGWRPFSSDQVVVTVQPGFDWDGRIAVLPGVAVRVHDAYVAGEGVLHASLFGLVSLANLRGGSELSEGELLRFLAEAPWYPTALLPSQGVRWEALDERAARATLQDRARAVSLDFTFDAAGLIDTARAEARGRAAGGRLVPTPWQGRFWGYEEHHGIRVPSEGEVAWLLPEGPAPYWRGRLTELEYRFAS